MTISIAKKILKINLKLMTNFSHKAEVPQNFYEELQGLHFF